MRAPNLEKAGLDFKISTSTSHQEAAIQISVHVLSLITVILLTFLFSRNDFYMGIGEQEVEVHWDVCSQILKKCFLLTEIKQIWESHTTFMAHSHHVVELVGI